MKTRLKREAPDPLYTQLKDALVGEIVSGRYRPHDRIPSERELSTRFSVSRMTARQALLDLVREGALYTRVGKGTFVAQAKIDQPLRSLTGFSQDMQARNTQPGSRILEARTVSATAEVAAALRLLPATDVTLLSRLRLADGEPLALEIAYLPVALCPGLLKHDFARESLYAVLEKDYGFKLTHAEQTLEAGLAGPREVELLGLTPPAAVQHIQRLTFRQDGVPVEYVLSTYRGDRYKFRSMLQTGAV
ncbi:MAG: GntR family transcriptional regulator [Anaerolineales bacterium]|nr:GntR family transcriptional regulator [Anaerolineales bacterium]